MSIQPNQQFSKSMMRLVRARTFKGDKLNEVLGAINAIRANYPWSERAYDDESIDDVYVITCLKVIYGFIECSYRDLDFESNKRPTIFLHELHVSAHLQRAGAGSAVLEHLLKKSLCIEMVVANKNLQMLSLVSKFGAEYLHVTNDTRTVILKPSGACGIA